MVGVQQVTIPSGSALSGATQVNLSKVVGLVMPAAWTAAAVTFQVSVDGGYSWNDVYDQAAGAEYSIGSTVATAGRMIILNPLQTSGFLHMRVRSGTGAAPVNQAADRVLSVLVRNVT